MDSNPQTEPLLCIICGYDLDGLAAEGLCPECGTPIERSLSGDQLAESSPAYVASLTRGSFTIIAAIVVQVLVFLVQIVNSIIGSGLPNPTIDGAAQLVSFAASVGGLIGWWWLSAPDPRLSGVYSGTSARQWVRGAVIAKAALSLLGFIATIAFVTSASGFPQTGNATFGSIAIGLLLLSLLNFVATGIWFFASMLYLRWLAPRLPNAKVYKRSKMLMWLGPLLVTVGAFCLMLGPVIALVLYWNMIYWVWKDLKAIKQEQYERAGLVGM